MKNVLVLLSGDTQPTRVPSDIAAKLIALGKAAPFDWPSPTPPAAEPADPRGDELALPAAPEGLEFSSVAESEVELGLEPGEIADPEAYEAAKAEGTIEEIDPPINFRTMKWGEIQRAAKARNISIRNANKKQLIEALEAYENQDINAPANTDE